MCNAKIVEVDRKEFFKVLGESLTGSMSVKKMDDPANLKCGFLVDGVTNYLMHIAELRYAKKEGMDISAYLSLEE